MSAILKISDLRVAVDGKPILKGVNLEIRQGEIHALMGTTVSTCRSGSVGDQRVGCVCFSCWVPRI